ncbi:RNA 2'-phosphotransferase [Psychrobacter urativorans]|uniref:RNA 2'-phosphotransferase n=1 Tax=Psychrobacter urativorans TaxID=45610 RepID=UPI003BB74683
MSAETNKISKFLSYILRHEPQSINLTLDTEGWANIDQLISLANAAGQQLSREQILQVVESSDKKRFTLSENNISIRAAQGHSLRTVNISFQEQQPPAILLHGTAIRNIDAIKQQGLIAGARQHVHLTENDDTAKATGLRYGKPIVLTIDSLAMYRAGFVFFQADNKVWLTSNVPPEYIKF